jgi:hypothetical protein
MEPTLLDGHAVIQDHRGAWEHVQGAIWLPSDLGRETYRRKQFLLRLVRRGVRGERRGRLVATLGRPMILEVPDGKSPWAKPQLASPHRLEA